MGLDADLQDVRACVRKTVHEVLGQEFDYTLFTDLTTDPPTKVVLLAIPMRATPTRFNKRRVGNTEISDTDDLYQVSRDTLVSAGNKLRPTEKDHFVVAGSTEPIAYVRDWEDDDALPGSYTLLVNAEEGFSIRG